MRQSIQRIAVLGGSFNPPTLAHLRLVLAALDEIQGDMGLFVPSSQAYVTRKMKKQRYKREVFSEETRLAMLEAMCREDSRLKADCLEYAQNSRGRTFETMEAIQAKHPGAELWFILGGDKLRVLSRWHRIEELLQQFRFLVVDRDGVLPEDLFQSNPLLSQYRQRFQVMAQPEGIKEISSSRVRELLRYGDGRAAEMVYPAVWEMLLTESWTCFAERKQLGQTESRLQGAITRFRGEYDFLSNFFEAPVEFGGILFGSGEAAFQAQKCVTEEERLLFRELRPAMAKKTGRHVALRPDWEQVKAGLMEEIVRAKFAQNPELASKLAATGDRPIIEGNTWNDAFWGVDLRTGQGENHLGKILMKVRGELRGEE